MATTYSQTIAWKPFSLKHKLYIRKALQSKMSVGEGAVRCGKTIDHCIIASAYLELCPDKIHLASGSSLPNAKLNIGDCNGFGLEHIFRGRCHWGKYRDNDALFINTKTGEKIVIFAGGGKADSYKKILGNSYGLWIATEINEHYDCDDSRTSFIKVAMARQVAALKPMILWDLNPSNPRARIYTDYIDNYAENGLKGGYNYEHFTIADNLAISEERRLEIISQYGDENSVWYRRDILGERCTCEGLVYQQLADHYNEYLTYDKPKDSIKFVIGVDFGGNLSFNALVCVAFNRNYDMVVVKSERLDAKNVDANILCQQFELFVRRIKDEYGVRVIEAYCDSAEKTLINSIRNHCNATSLGVIVKNAIKGKINDRIKFVLRMLYAHKIKWHIEAKSSIDAMSSCVYDTRDGHQDERLDNNSCDIDSCDATEYALEPMFRNILMMMEVR